LPSTAGLVLTFRLSESSFIYAPMNRQFTLSSFQGSPFQYLREGE
jgi:hypothetical protein